MLISVIIPLYNKENFILTTLCSILKQNLSNYEIIIIDDGSTDDSVNIVRDFIISNSLSYKFKLFSYENGGVSVARNRGIKKANGKFLVFLDADDILQPGYFDDIVFTAEKLKYDFDILGYKYTKGQTNEWMMADQYINYFEYYVKNGPPFCSSSVVVKNIFGDSIFPAGEWIGEDIYAWSKLINEFGAKVYLRDFIAVEYVSCDTGAMSKKKDIIKLIRDYSYHSSEDIWFHKFISHHKEDYIKSCIIHNDYKNAKKMISTEKNRYYLKYRIVMIFPRWLFNIIKKIKNI
ncbi:glycosyltransferase family 2 protein [Edwardsiella tarda]